MTPADETFLQRLFAESRAGLGDAAALTEREAAFLIEWQYTARRRDWITRFPYGSDLIITVDEERAGRIWLARELNAIRIVDLVVASAYRRRGVATAVLRDLQTGSARPLALSVACDNIAALSVYDRCGFVESSRDVMDIAMRWEPSPAVQPSQFHPTPGTPLCWTPLSRAGDWRLTVSAASYRAARHLLDSE
ncbi:GNAT family N-acetyltransferase [Actinacidiphila oryziradicis]|uniref:GNAT family N-acetyltransferase n=1 Tax=Actinacidiphila oryziradicis TaxID=2571141 RepID=UPI00145C711A|nr:GNAT family N-acetyltransferase [Actinacidiphila oryziradicis]